MKVYFLSGLGADERAFKHLKLSNDIEAQHLKWPQPDKKESLEKYCQKVTKLIDDSGDFSIVGLSFGGMVMIELLKTIKPKHAILLSSVGSRKEMPDVLKFIGKTGIDSLVPRSFLNKVYPFVHMFTGLKKEEDKKVWNEIVRDSDAGFLKWAIHEIVNWKNELRPQNIFHIHGSNDKTFPIEYVKPDHIIEGGGHFMILSHAREISRIINEQFGYS